MKRIKSFILMLMFFSILAGCSGKTTISFMREDVTLDFVNRICVLPLENNTDKKYVPELARDVLNTQIMAMNMFDVIDKGIVDSVLQEEAIIPGSPVNAAMLNRLGQRLNVEAIMVGTVDIAEDRRIGSVIVPQVSMTLRLVEIQSGSVLWQASGHYSGDSVVGRLFGMTPDDAYKVTAKLAKELLSTMPEKGNVPASQAPRQPIAVPPQSPPTSGIIAPESVVIMPESNKTASEILPITKGEIAAKTMPVEETVIKTAPTEEAVAVPAVEAVVAEPAPEVVVAEPPAAVEEVVVEAAPTEEAVAVPAVEAVVAEPAPEVVVAEPPAAVEEVVVEVAPSEEVVAVPAVEAVVAEPVPVAVQVIKVEVEPSKENTVPLGVTSEVAQPVNTEAAQTVAEEKTEETHNTVEPVVVKVEIPQEPILHQAHDIPATVQP